MADDQQSPVPGKTANQSKPNLVDGISVVGEANVISGGNFGTNSIDGANYISGDPSSQLSSSPLIPGAESALIANRGLSLLDVSNSVSTSPPRANATTNGYDCVKNTTGSSRLVAYAPVHIDESSGDWEIHYIDHLYSMAYARFVSGGYTTELEQCVIGGGRNKHFFQRPANIESEVSLNNGVNRLIGFKWGTAVDNGAVSSAINFEVALSKVTKISGALPVSSGGQESGGVGDGLCGK